MATRSLHDDVLLEIRRTGDDPATRGIFDRFPFGLLVCAPDGAVLAANGAARELLDRGPGAPRAEEDTCCALLGCCRDDAPLGGQCLTTLALEAGGALPDVRFELPGIEPPRAVWVTAAPLTERTALLQMRPADPRDRRRRTEPHWLNGPALRVRTLGRTSVASAEGSIDGAWLGQLPGQLLKALLCERGHVAHSELLLARLWPDAGRGAMVNLRHTIFALRKRLEPARERHSLSSFVIARDGGYLLDGRLIHVDADDFEAAADAGLRAHAVRAHAGARESLERAEALYAGEFLADEPYTDWVFAERDRLHGIACRVLRALADVRREIGDFPGAVDALVRLAELEPFDGACQRELLGLLVDLDRRSEAIRRFRQFRAQWTDAFGEPPDFDFKSIRQTD